MADFDIHENLRIGTITIAPNPPESGTTLSVSNADGEKFPDPESGNNTEYNVTIFPPDATPDIESAEIVRITAKNVGETNTEFTIIREQEGTDAREIKVGDKIAWTITKKTITDVEDAVNDLETDFLTEHKSDNTHDETKVAMLAGAQTFTGVKTFSATPKTDAIAERTADAGVTIDGLLIKDGTFVFPTCKAARATNYTLASGTDTALPLDGEAWDTHNMHDNSTNPSRITVPSGGFYFVSAVARFASSTTGGRALSIRVNGNITYIQNKRNGQTGAGGTDEINVAGVVNCNANDYIEMYVYQDTGSNLTVYSSSHLIVAKLF